MPRGPEPRSLRIAPAAALAVALLVAATGPAGAMAAGIEPARTIGPGSSPAERLTVAVTPGGRALVASRTDRVLMVAQRPPGGGFRSPVRVPLRGWSSRFLSIALDERGRMALLEAVPEDPDQGGGIPCCPRLATVQLDARGRRTRTRTITPSGRRAAGSLVASPGGRALVSFEVEDREHLLYGTPGGGFVRVPALPRLDVGEPLFHLGQGRSQLATYAGDERLLYARASLPARPWSRLATLREEEEGTSVLHPRIAFGAGGNAVAVWEEERPAFGRYHVFAARMRRGRFGRPQQVAALDGTAAVYDVAIDSTGRATAIWMDRLGSLMFASAAAGRPFGRARELWRAPAGQRISYIGVAGSPGARHVVVTWLAFPPAPEAPRDDTIRAAIVRGGEVRGGVRTLDAAGSGDVLLYEPQAALDARGRGVIAWIRQEGLDDTGIGNRYLMRFAAIRP